MLNLQMTCQYWFIRSHAQHASYHSSLVLPTFLTATTRCEDICLIRSWKILGIIQFAFTYIKNQLLVVSSCLSPSRIITLKTANITLLWKRVWQWRGTTSYPLFTTLYWSFQRKKRSFLKKLQIFIFVIKVKNADSWSIVSLLEGGNWMTPYAATRQRIWK